jgi:hypothetical protein
VNPRAAEPPGARTAHDMNPKSYLPSSSSSLPSK